MALTKTALSIATLFLITTLSESDASFGNPSKISPLTESNWTTALQPGSEWMLVFYTSWCPACRSFKPVFEELCESQKMRKFHCGSIDVDRERSIAGRFFVERLPTIFHKDVDGHFRRYANSYNVKKVEEFVLDRQWLAVTPLPWWRAPTAYHMAILGYMFSTAAVLQDWHQYLTVEREWPAYLSYATFGVGVVFFGIALGFGVVLCVDLIAQLTNWLGGAAKHVPEQAASTEESPTEARATAEVKSSSSSEEQPGDENAAESVSENEDSPSEHSFAEDDVEKVSTGDDSDANDSEEESEAELDDEENQTKEQSQEESVDESEVANQPASDSTKPEQTVPEPTFDKPKARAAPAIIKTTAEPSTIDTPDTASTVSESTTVSNTSKYNLRKRRPRREIDD